VGIHRRVSTRDGGRLHRLRRRDDHAVGAVAMIGHGTELFSGVGAGEGHRVTRLGFAARVRDGARSRRRRLAVRANARGRHDHADHRSRLGQGGVREQRSPNNRTLCGDRCLTRRGRRRVVAV